MVPIEICDETDGSLTYLSNSFERRVMSLRDFITEFVEEKGDNGGGEFMGKRAYLAQYQLFDQIPTLLGDITTVPEFTSLKGIDDERAPPSCEYASEPIVSGWFGRSTVSPLHNDPYENLLAQVVGKKVRSARLREGGREAS